MVHFKLLERCVGYLLYFDMTFVSNHRFPIPFGIPSLSTCVCFLQNFEVLRFGQIRKAEEEEWRPRLGNQYSGDPFVTVAAAVTDEAMRQLMTPCLGSIGPVTTVSI